MTVPIDRLLDSVRIYVDSNIFIYAVDGDAKVGAKAVALLEALEAGPVQVVVSSLVRAECLVGSWKTGRSEDRDLFTLLLETTVKVPLSDRIVEFAAQIAGQSGIKLADAIHLAAAEGSGCTGFLTNDRKLAERAPRLDMFVFSDIEVL